MRITKNAITLDVTIDEEKNKAVVFVQMSARQGRQPTVRCRPSTVRDILTENGIEVSELVSGQAIHNSMSRRLGLRTIDDLKTTMVFMLPVKETKKVVAKKVVAKKEKPVKLKAQSLPVTASEETQSPKETVVVATTPEAPAKKPSASTVAKKTTTRRRPRTTTAKSAAKSTTSRKTENKT